MKEMPDKPEKPTLLLLPNVLGPHKHHQPYLPSSVDKAVATIDGLIAESVTEGRRFLGRFETKKPANQIPIALFNEHSKNEDIDFLLEPIKKGERWGLISDAGVPCVADPGAKLVQRARQLGIAVQAFIGPSSILLALMQSGLPGQKFFFHGYLSKEPDRLKKEIREMEKRSKADDITQIFIETPYRNQQMLEALLNGLHEDTWLCVAWELTMPEQGLVSHQVKQWRKMPLPNLEKRNAIFLFHA